MSQCAPARCVGILLAAGRGRRFDPQGRRSKLLEPVQGEAVAARACQVLARGCDAVIAVVRPGSPAALSALLEQCGAQTLVCPEADKGMGHSLAKAMRTVMAGPDLPDAVLVMPADLPWMKAESVVAVRKTWESADAGERSTRIALPVLPDGRRGHPVAFGRAHFDFLSHLTGDEGARALLRHQPVTTVTLDDPGILRDIDVPDDLPAS